MNENLITDMRERDGRRFEKERAEDAGICDHLHHYSRCAVCFRKPEKVQRSFRQYEYPVFSCLRRMHLYGVSIRGHLHQALTNGLR